MDGTFETAERIGGYRVVRHLARGSTSDVILARAEGPHGFARTVVLKVLLPELTRDPGVARKFAREASACAQLSHPAIVRLYDFFSLSVLEAQGAHLEEGQLVMVLEYVDGVPLNRLKSAVKAGGHTFDDRAALHVGTRLFSALAAAHEAVDDRGDPAPLIHRDVNPTNVLVPWDGHVKLADFGVAKVSGSSQDTQTGLLRGTYGYMAPEQVTGERPVTPRADVYAAAIIMWELLARRRAFQRGALGEVEALRAMAEPRLTSLDVLRPDVDASVRAALRRALEPDAELRTITAEEMVAVLRKVAPAELARQRLADLAERVRHEVDRLAPSRPPPKGERISGVDVQALLASRPPSKGPSQPPPKRDSEMPTFTPRAAPVVPVPRPPPRPDPSPSPPAVGAFRLRQESIEDIMSDGRRERPSERELKTPIGSVGPGRSLGDAIDEILEAAPAPSSGAKYPISLDNATHRRPLSSEPERTLGRSEIEAVGRFPSTAPSPPTGLSETLAVASSGAGRSDPPPRTQPLHDRTLAMAQAPPRPAPISNRPQSGAQTLASSQPPAASDGPAKPPLPSNRGKPPLPNTARAGGTRPLQATPAPSPAASGSVRAAPAAPTTAPAYVPAGPPPAPAPPPPSPAASPAPAASPPAAPQLNGAGAHADASHGGGAGGAGSGAPVAPHFHAAGSVPPPGVGVPPLVPIPASVSQVTGSYARPRPKRGGRVVLALLFLVAVAAAGGGVGYYVNENPRAPLSVKITGILGGGGAGAGAGASAGAAAGAGASAGAGAGASAGAAAGAGASAGAGAGAGVSADAPALASAGASAAAPASATASAVAPASASATASAAAPASASASAAAAATASAAPAGGVDATKGTIVTASARAGHRIYVDEKVVGQTPDAVTVRCGTRSVRLGSAGTKRQVDVPCGGEIAVEH